MTGKSVDFAVTAAQPAARLVASKSHVLPGTLWPNADELHLTALPPTPRSACRARVGVRWRESFDRASVVSWRGSPPSLRPQALKSFSEAQAMHNKFSRTFAALLLIFSLWAGSLTAVAVPQTQAPQSTANQGSGDKNKKDKKSDKNAQASPSPAAQANAGKPLSEKEDPRLIGKRNINKGFIASISGGLDKEVALGRQLAAEVDREAKFIDDPVITEYVNRVGQNIAPHSDAKVPFTITVIDSDEA